MPGTVPKSFDPSLVSTSTPAASTPSPSSSTPPPPAAAKAAVSPSATPLSAASLSSPQPPSHPSSGVASLGASTAIANASHTAALSDGNPSAKMTASKAPSAPSGLPAAANKTPKDVALEKEREQETALKKFVETQGHFSLVRNFRLADAFTLMNAFCAGQSLFFSARYLATNDTRYAWMSLWCPFFGAIFDLLDGKIARWRGGGSMLGQELDSLADSISFGAAPCVAAYALGLRTTLDTIVLTLFICAGVARLARFNVTTALIPHDPSGKAKYFEGLPIPTSLILVGGMAVCLVTGKFEGAASVPMSGGAWQFTNRLVPSAASSRTGAKMGLLDGYSYGVPLGTVDIGPRQVLALVGVKVAQGSWADALEMQVHWISLLWLAWSVAMVSKTLRVPKP